MAKLPQQFQASGVTCGIKDSGRPDLALLYSKLPCVASGVFTQNRVVGAPVTVCRQRLPSSDLRGVVINSGNANACTGEQGRRDAEAMTQQTAEQLSLTAEQFAVMSTGIIGVPLPMSLISTGIPQVVASLTNDESATQAAATAMMTTDTFAKFATDNIRLSNGTVRITGVAKGAAMIAPNMATMLAVVMTDANLTPTQADGFLRSAVDRSFNCISVDGHMSTSDSVMLLANGAADICLESDEDQQVFLTALQNVSEKLATDIIKDGEGAQHFITIDVEGLADRQQAFDIAKKIAESALVKTAMTGNDPNWGRITSAAGYADVAFDAAYLNLSINDVIVYQNGHPTDFDAAHLSQQMATQQNVSLKLWLTGGPCAGQESVRFWTTDLTQEYVRLNSEYTT